MPSFTPIAHGIGRRVHLDPVSVSRQPASSRRRPTTSTPLMPLTIGRPSARAPGRRPGIRRCRPTRCRRGSRRTRRRHPRSSGSRRSALGRSVAGPSPSADVDERRLGHTDRRRPAALLVGRGRTEGQHRGLTAVCFDELDGQPRARTPRGGTRVKPRFVSTARPSSVTLILAPGAGTRLTQARTLTASSCGCIRVEERSAATDDLHRERLVQVHHLRSVPSTACSGGRYARSRYLPTDGPCRRS